MSQVSPHRGECCEKVPPPVDKFSDCMDRLDIEY